MFLLSLLVDLPNKRWENSADFKNGPILRLAVIVLYGIILIVMYKDKDFVSNFYSSDPNIVKRTKLKFYLYHLCLISFIVYGYSHETMDP
jgi:hypothetical protein